MERIATMSNIRLIISDIDGTILTSNHQVDEQLIELIKKNKNVITSSDLKASNLLSFSAPTFLTGDLLNIAPHDIPAA